jgi:hypothetical protein
MAPRPTSALRMPRWRSGQLQPSRLSALDGIVAFIAGFVVGGIFLLVKHSSISRSPADGVWPSLRTLQRLKKSSSYLFSGAVATVDCHEQSTKSYCLLDRARSCQNTCLHQ